MSAKKITEAVNGAMQITVVDQLKSQLLAAEKEVGGSEELQAKLEVARAEVTKLVEALKPFAEARNRVLNLKSAIKALEAPVNRSSGNRGVTMTDEVKAKLSATHKRLWAQKKAASAAAQAQAL